MRESLFTVREHILQVAQVKLAEMGGKLLQVEMQIAEGSIEAPILQMIILLPHIGSAEPMDRIAELSYSLDMLNTDHPGCLDLWADVVHVGIECKMEWRTVVFLSPARSRWWRRLRATASAFVSLGARGHA